MKLHVKQHGRMLRVVLWVDMTHVDLTRFAMFERRAEEEMVKVASATLTSLDPAVRDALLEAGAEPGSIGFRVDHQHPPVGPADTPVLRLVRIGEGELPAPKLPPWVPVVRCES